MFSGQLTLMDNYIMDRGFIQRKAIENKNQCIMIDKSVLVMNALQGVLYILLVFVSF